MISRCRLGGVSERHLFGSCSRCRRRDLLTETRTCRAGRRRLRRICAGFLPAMCRLANGSGPDHCVRLRLARSRRRRVFVAPIPVCAPAPYGRYFLSLFCFGLSESLSLYPHSLPSFLGFPRQFMFIPTRCDLCQTTQDHFHVIPFPCGT